MTHLLHALALIFAGILAAAVLDANTSAQGREPPHVDFRALNPIPAGAGITYIIIRDGRDNSNKVQV